MIFCQQEHMYSIIDDAILEAEASKALEDSENSPLQFEEELYGRGYEIKIGESKGDIIYQVSKSNWVDSKNLKLFYDDAAYLETELLD